jgi:hypothetical protein
MLSLLLLREVALAGLYGPGGAPDQQLGAAIHAMPWPLSAL